MFAKVFQQIFDSSIAENYRYRHIFMDMLVLADPDGGIDMTLEAIARRTNVPVDELREAITALSLPDASSRTQEFEGRRLVPIDAKRSWGWRVVSYGHYRAIRDEETRRQYQRDYYVERKAKKSLKKQVRTARDGNPQATMLPRAPHEP
jgi:hypothetical protein